MLVKSFMIQHSFTFLEKISVKREKLWRQQGIITWNDFLKAEKVKGMPDQKKSYFNRKIREAQGALSAGNSAYFIERLPTTATWRLYDSFKDECGFLDIEIDSYGKMVVVGISDYFHTNFFVRGVNLEKELLEQELQKYKLLVTFNGAAFDLPRLQKQFGISLTVPHIDLKPLCVKLGWKGGLKEVEKLLNLKRPAHLYGNPVDLWKAFQASGDREYLELLLDYNREDVENLKGVMEKVYQKMKAYLYKPPPFLTQNQLHSH